MQYGSGGVNHVQHAYTPTETDRDVRSIHHDGVCCSHGCRVPVPATAPVDGCLKKTVVVTQSHAFCSRLDQSLADTFCRLSNAREGIRTLGPLRERVLSPPLLA